MLMHALLISAYASVGAGIVERGFVETNAQKSAEKSVLPRLLLQEYSASTSASSESRLLFDIERQSVAGIREGKTCARSESNGIPFGDRCDFSNVRFWMRYGARFGNTPIAKCPEITAYEGGGYLRHACSFACDTPGRPKFGAYIEYKVGKYRENGDFQNYGDGCSREVRDAVLGNIGALADAELGADCQSTKDETRRAAAKAVNLYMHPKC